MRRFKAIVSATLIETCSEPLSLLLFLGAAATMIISSLFSFHQFGEPTRLARDAGLSAMLVFGSAFAVFCTIKVFRRELESGTAQMALAHPVSRPLFFLAKAMGAVLSALVFEAALAGVALTLLTGAEVGGATALRNHDLPSIWPVALALAAGGIALALAVAAALNAFARLRFTTWAFLLLAVTTPLAAAVSYRLGLRLYPGDVGEAVRFIPAAVSVSLPAPVFAVAAAAFSVRLRDNAAAALSSLLFVFSLPAMGNYYLSESLAKGGTVPWANVALAALAALPLALAFLLLGVHLFNDRDLG